MDRPVRTTPESWRPVAAVAPILCVACLVLLAVLLILRRGNLGWDDADYLRRGLAHARESRSAGPLGPLPELVAGLLDERPKPPLLVGWISLGALGIGKANVDLLMIHATILPFALLLLAAFLIARRLGGGAAGALAVLLLLASPRCLAFGGKVMVETFLGLWVAVAIGSLSVLPHRPTRRTGILLGAAVGLALLTKLTAPLLLAGAVAATLPRMLRKDPDRRRRLRCLGWAGVACLLVAGPWYARNLGPAVRFAGFSSRFNLAAEGRVESVPTAERLGSFVQDLPGWPLAGLLALLGAYLAAARGRSSDPASKTIAEGAVEPPFARLAACSTLLAAAALLVPPYFDTRFLLPLWPSLSIGLGVILAGCLERLPTGARASALGGLASCVGIAALGVYREPVATTPWPAAALIDRLVGEHGVSRVANVGNLVSWNVCKTGLLNELREHPEGCFVLGDLSRESADGLRERLPRFDALLVLDDAAYPPDAIERAPGLNRAAAAIAAVVHDDPGLIRIEGPALDGLPPLHVYVRRDSRPAVGARTAGTPGPGADSRTR